MPNGTPEQWDASAQQAEARRQPWPNCANGSCVEVTDRGSRIEFTSTISPDRGLVSYDRDEVSQHILDVKAGRYDHLLVDVPASV